MSMKAWLVFPAFLAGLSAAAHADAAEQPKRVVSMNLCTDQMAMLVAAPGQLVSVSYLASDPSSSMLAAEAEGYRINHGLAEEIFLLKPDLVLAGTYTTRATVGLLRKLGIRVEEFAPETSFDDIRANLRRMGDVLGRPQRADAMIADLDHRLADAELATTGRRMTAATYYANGYTSGGGTLVDAVIAAANLANIAAGLGYVGTAQLPLEVLLLADPDVLASSRTDYAAPALAEQGFEHPAFRAQASRSQEVNVPARYTICGAPFTAEAVRLLAQAARTRQEVGK